MYKNILVPVAFDEDRDPQQSLKLVEVLRAEDAKLTILHVMEFIPAHVTSLLPEDILEQSRKDAATRLNEIAKNVPNAIVKMTSGHAGRSIVDYADETGVDCIIIASHKPGFENYFLGSTADRVVRHAKCAVHVIR